MSQSPRNTIEIAHRDATGPFILSIVPFAGPTRRIALPRAGRVLVGQSRPGHTPSFTFDTAFVELDDQTVSTMHAQIDLHDNKVRIVDLQSRNGTWIGGGRIESAEMRVGTCVVVGRTVLCLEEVMGETMSAVESVSDDEDELLPGFIGRAPVIRHLAEQVRAYGQLSGSVLIRGESGCGKEVVAHALHQLSPRAQGPFQAINLAALPRELAEAELFGHERGAFTGANTARPGVFELAHGGTLLLDELGELPLELQAKLLRVLETNEVRRLGARTARKVDVRIVAATWAPLEQRIREGSFREDLFHRIAVLMLEIPPLRARRSDLPRLARHLLTRYASELGNRTLASSALAKLCEQEWPGNVRELRNVLYRAAAQAPDETITLADLQRALAPSPPGPLPRPTRDRAAAVALVRSYGSVTKAARVSGIPRETLRDWVRATAYCQ